MLNKIAIFSEVGVMTADVLLKSDKPMREITMTDKNRDEAQKTSWGPKLFLATFVGIMLFFYWVLIYSGGVVVQHG